LIRFFRNIRESLIAEGKTGKYFKYALGEIFLVVIGILIAVSINNLNISIQNEDKEVLYLTRLTTNLGYDVRMYSAVLAKDSLLLDTLSQVEQDIPGFVNSIDKPVDDLNFLITGYKFTANRTVIDNLISSGQIELLRRNFLVEAIFLYYRNTDSVETGVDAAIPSHNEETISTLILQFDEDSKSDAHYIQTLENSIAFRRYLIEKQMEWYLSQKERAQKLIDRINEEIELIEEVY
jgi:hypothetical protein